MKHRYAVFTLFSDGRSFLDDFGSLKFSLNRKRVLDEHFPYDKHYVVVEEVSK